MTWVFTLDATLALVLSALMLGAAVYMIAEPKRAGDEHLYQVSGDLLAVAEEKQLLHRMAGGDLSAFEELESMAPQNVCIRLELRNETEGLIYTEDSGCPPKEEWAVARRTFVKDMRFYSAEMRLWSR